MPVATLSLLIKEKASELGFDLCGITSVQPILEWKERFSEWLKSEMNGNMEYLSRNISMRSDPGLLVENAKSIIVTGLNYFPGSVNFNTNNFIISKYAYGDDYHKLIKGKLKILLNYIRELQPYSGGRIFADSAPIFEKAWARQAGLGWVGKNSVLINPEIGSFFFIGEIITDIELSYDKPYEKDNCRTCSKCVEACPTGAININKTIDARRCISYLTVENKSEIPLEFNGKTRSRIFGCDICQDICPWNKRAKSHNINELRPSENLIQMNTNDWVSLTEGDFEKLFKKAAIKRVKFEGLKRNISFAINSITTDN